MLSVLASLFASDLVVAQGRQEVASLGGNDAYEAQSLWNFRLGDVDPGVRISDYDRSEDSLVREITVTRSGRVIFHMRFEEGLLVGSGLVKPGTEGLYLVTILGVGAHSQRMLVHELELEEGPNNGGNNGEEGNARCVAGAAWSFERIEMSGNVLAITGDSYENDHVLTECRL